MAAASDVGSAMDVEEGATAAGRKDQDKVLVRDDSYTITERKALPVEVQQAVAGSGASFLLCLVRRGELTSRCSQTPILSQ